jgi:hypothetical protein
MINIKKGVVYRKDIIDGKEVLIEVPAASDASNDNPSINQDSSEQETDKIASYPIPNAILTQVQALASFALPIKDEFNNSLTPLYDGQHERWKASERLAQQRHEETIQAQYSIIELLKSNPNSTIYFIQADQNNHLNFTLNVSIEMQNQLLLQIEQYFENINLSPEKKDTLLKSLRDWLNTAGNGASIFQLITMIVQLLAK